MPRPILPAAPHPAAIPMAAKKDKAPVPGGFAGALAGALAAGGLPGAPDETPVRTGPPPETPAREVDPRRLPPGVPVAMGTLRGLGDPLRAAPENPGRAQGMERTALLQQVAGRLVGAVEVLRKGERPEVHLSLELGRLGRAEVAVGRSSGGGVEIAFRTASAEAGDLLSRHAGELRERLAERGIETREIRVACGEGASGDAPGTGAGPGSGRQGGGEEGQGRSRGRFVVPEPDPGEEDRP